MYVVEQLSTGRRRALKVLHAQLNDDEGMRARFEREARVGARIESEHVVEVLAAGMDAESGLPWLVMELLEGEDLADHLARQGPLDHAHAGAIGAQLCHALAAAHSVGVVHRDLKPENVFLAKARRLGADFTVKVLDFDIAKIVADAKSRTTDAVGTPCHGTGTDRGGRGDRPAGGCVRELRFPPLNGGGTLELVYPVVLGTNPEP